MVRPRTPDRHPLGVGFQEFSVPELSRIGQDTIEPERSLLLYARFCTTEGKIALGNAPRRPENPGLIVITPQRSPPPTNEI